MTHTAESTERFSMGPMLAAMFVAPVIGALGGIGIATIASWTTEGSAWTMRQTVSAAAGCWMMGGLIGVVVLALASGMLVRRVAVGMMASSLVRAGIALFDGLAISLVFKPELKVFWAAFLVAGLLCLILETVWAMNLTRRMAGSALKPVAAS
jgi:hypothetical protein